MELRRIIICMLACAGVLLMLVSCGKAEDEAGFTEEYEAVSEIVLPNIEI